MGLFGIGQKKKKQKQFNQAVELYNAGNIDQAFSLFDSLSRSGIVEARYYCGLICEKKNDMYGAVDEYDSAVYYGYENAKEPFERALKKLEEMDPYLAGTVYRRKKDYTHAVELMTKAASQDNVRAQRECVKIFQEGKIVPKDLSKVFYWNKKLAEKGDEDAQYECAKMYHEGIAVEKDMQKALYWYKKAAQNGQIDASLYLDEEMIDYEDGTW